jgi:hypothetical protein
MSNGERWRLVRKGVLMSAVSIFILLLGIYSAMVSSSRSWAR